MDIYLLLQRQSYNKLSVFFSKHITIKSYNRNPCLMQLNFLFLWLLMVINAHFWAFLLLPQLKKRFSSWKFASSFPVLWVQSLSHLTLFTAAQQVQKHVVSSKTSTWYQIDFAMTQQLNMHQINKKAQMLIWSFATNQAWD